jgi:hypothetical protein
MKRLKGPDLEGVRRVVRLARGEVGVVDDVVVGVAGGEDTADGLGGSCRLSSVAWRFPYFASIRDEIRGEAAMLPLCRMSQGRQTLQFFYGFGSLNIL